MQPKTIEHVARKQAEPNRSEEGIHAACSSGSAPLSSAQQHLWFIAREGGSAAWHVPLALRVRGELRVDALKAALHGIVNRHETLRAVFFGVDGEPMQQVLPDGRFVLQQVDLRGQDDASVLERLRREVAAPFDLSTGPLMRSALLRVTADEHILLITIHHIVSDGWSLGVLIRELGALYAAYLSGAPDLLPPLPSQYADYVTWQRQRLAQPQVQAQLEYWKSHLQGAPALIDLPTDRPRPATQSYRGAIVPVLLGRELTNELKTLARQLSSTLATMLFTAWSIVLMRLSGQQDVVVGIPVADRRRTEFEPLIGYLADTWAVRVHCEDDLTIHDLLRRVRKTTLEAQAHQDVPFEHVVQALQPIRTLGHSPVFQVMFAFLNVPTNALNLPGLITSAVDAPVQTAPFDLLLNLRDSAKGVGGFLNYASDLFDDVTIRRWVEHFRSVLKEMTRNPREKVSLIALLGERERCQVIENFSAMQAPNPRI